MRKEVELDEKKVVKWLQKAADKKKWSLKKYMENILTSDAEKIKNRLTSHADIPHSNGIITGGL